MDITRSTYWEERYRHKDTPWNLDRAHPAIVEFFRNVEDISQKILIPGAGYAHEAEFLWKLGYKNIYVCDWAASALNRFHQRVPSFPVDQLLEENFFDLQDTFALIVEHTFFCALPPQKRSHYVKKAAALLEEDTGILTGVLFGDDLGPDGPPFGGTEEDYRSLFEMHFDPLDFTEIHKNQSPRDVGELFLTARKR